MPQAARTGMDEHRHPTRFEAERFRCDPVIDQIDSAQFQEMVSGTQRSQLLASALIGQCADALWFRIRETAALLGMLEVLGLGVAVFDRPVRAATNQPLKFFDRKVRNCALRPHARRNRVEQCVREPSDLRRNFAKSQIGPRQPDPTVNVVADAAWRYHPAIRIHRGDPPNWKTIAPVDVRHR